VRVSIIRDIDSNGHFELSARDASRFSANELRNTVITSLAGCPAQLVVDPSAPQIGARVDRGVARSFVKEKHLGWSRERRREYVIAANVRPTSWRPA
jgi:hypothetical protein